MATRQRAFRACDACACVHVTPVRACMCARASACLIEFTDADTQKRQPGTRLRCLLTALSDGPCVTKPFLGLL